MIFSTLVTGLVYVWDAESSSWKAVFTPPTPAPGTKLYRFAEKVS